MSFVALSDSEYEVITLMWNEGRPLSFREILDYFDKNTDRGWKKQTLNTFLFRMQQKGIIEAIGTDKYKIYSPLISREDYVTQESANFVKKRFQGSIAKMLLAFSGGERITKDDAAELKKIIEEWENQ